MRERSSDARQLAVHDRGHERELVPPVVHASIDEELPGEDPGRVDVDGAIDALHAELLGRHVRELSLEDTLACVMGARARFGDPEIEQARDALDADHHVGGRYVAMNDVERAAAFVLHLVRAMEPGEDPGEHGDGHVDGDRLVRDLRHLHELAERNAVHVFLHEDQLVAGDDDVEYGHDVRVMDARGDAGLVVEHRDEVGIVGELRVQSLRRDEAREALGADEACRVDGRHASARDGGVQQIASEGLRRARALRLVHRGIS